ncbi:MAG: alpha/beta fold hydrolase [Thermoleophilia bacterium]|nr:alpha/beta fold hydrolase [Thermoleophilia bacterium]
MRIPTGFDIASRINLPLVVGAVELKLSHEPAPGTPLDAAGRAAAARANPVVLVPGFGGSAKSYAAIGRALDRDGFRHTTFVPPHHGLGDVRTAAALLGTAVNNELAATGATQVQLVGHSKGGAVIGELERSDLAAGSVSRVESITTIAYPHQGLAAIFPLNTFAGQLATSLASEVGTGMVQTNEGSFVDALLAANLPRHVRMESIFAAGKDGLVEPARAHLDGARNVPIGTPDNHPDHMHMLVDDRAYEALRANLLNIEGN